QRPADSLVFRLIQPILIMAVFFFLLRLFSAPVVDFYARPAATMAAATKTVGTPKEGSPATTLPSWLQLPWTRMFIGASWQFPDGFLGEGVNVSEDGYQDNFRDYFV